MAESSAEISIFKASRVLAAMVDGPGKRIYSSKSCYVKCIRVEM